MTEKLYNEKEALEYLGITRQKLDELMKAKQINAYRLGGEFLRFKQPDLDQAKLLLSVEEKPQQQEVKYSFFSRIRDYVYYNDFYIIVAILIIVLLAIIFKISF
ncbi:MAG: hypothetical protein COW11_04085 [Candidatus Omnitrophica bacterium CG12_big_fil_rev_8_21_14_0_65_43_15]|uniref:Helix-turn-helix domain-containing protein n=1 Tax=Candidatus Taenaricola geysiri TaxID=1974752 RepID=A0A2J0LL02_9BACT|nr:MAG: hypothetical protein AUJ89_06185 [Candidatus Omnitrophica bacterium CG1_02_43_210]PIR65902.1 MAG: hypothetical protein COU52_01810 [Candidatus Omnitrophica bacterium CG10_big_fil_rev_8_21_14_0_10_43_8]PIV11916.1 MAG: hypothetical protein COS48_03480 [Candidatus Omnitrophica bacterium CG03_land_8_20_14_0_80_43_22]PIW66293.1 MAG: hypothetical protein COW11_04085 [Candidatus Omnitrophica bacterium CG12_big_fil_rev_8_21_14_0_65_43_15]PIW79727.1 MAG: hypothetical protein COZ98_05965 [Candida